MLVRKGSAKNVIVFPDADYDSASFGFSNGKYTFQHNALGADKFRYSWNFGQNWTSWQDWEDTTEIDASIFDDKDIFWDGQHLMVQCTCALLLCCGLDADEMLQIGLLLRPLRLWSSTQTADTRSSAACRSSSLAAPSTSGASTRVSPRR